MSTENLNMQIYNSLRTPPKDALKPIKAGRLKGMSDINPQYRIEELTKQFGPCGFGWSVEIVKEWVEEGSDGQKVAFVNIHLFVNRDGEWSRPIPGKGGSMFISNEKNGAYTSDEAFKMAYTDAISVAGKMLGVAADIYRGNFDSKYGGDKPVQGNTSTTSYPTSEKQIDFIRTLLKNEYIKPEEVERANKEMGKGLSKSDASAWIKKLNEAIKARERNFIANGHDANEVDAKMV